jgi:NhaP-type Na+/H+ or K+/H+ antiporter
LLNPVWFFAVAFILCPISQHVVDNYLKKELQPPHTVAVFLMGMALSAFANQYDDIVAYEAGILKEIAESIKFVQYIDFNFIFWLLLPPLLYEDAADGQWHVMVRVFPSSVLLAIPGVFCSAILTGIFISFLPNAGLSPVQCLIVGSILAATDPVAVIGALKALQAPEKLGDIIKGESLLNDGSAFVLFKVCLKAAQSSGEMPYITDIISQFFYMATGGLSFGLLSGVVLDLIFQLTHHKYIEMMILYAFVVGTFFWAEHLFMFSGVLAVVFLGFFTLAEGHYVQAENEHTFHVVLGFIAHSCNELIFLIAGVVTWRFGFVAAEEGLIDSRDVLDSFLLYIGIHLVRGILLVFCFPIMKNLGYGLSVKEALIMWYGGLRGAVGLAMVLEVAGTVQIDPRARAKIAFHVAVIVLMTLVINGMTVSRFYKWLKVYKVVEHHTVLLQRSVEKCEEIASCHVRLLRENWVYSNCYFDIIRNLVPALDGEGGEVVLEDVKGHEKISVNVKNLNKGFEYMANMSVARDHSDRLVQKLRFQKRWGAKSMRMALPMIDDEAEFKQTGRVPAHRGGKTTREMTRSATIPTHEKELLARHGSQVNDEHSLAKRRWHAAVMEIIISQRLVHAAQERAQRSREDELEMEKMQEAEETDLRSKVKEVYEDTETMMQLYQTIINAVKAQLAIVFESDLIHEAPYRILQVALQHAETAVEGSLEDKDFLLESGDPTLRTIHEQSHREQMQACLHVATEYIRWRLGRVKISGIGIKFWFIETFKLGRIWRPLQLQLEWRLFRRDCEMVFTFLVTLEHVLEELDVLTDFETIRESQEELCEYIKEQILPSIQRRSRRFFWFWEHTACARRILVSKLRILAHMTEEGLMQPEDRDFFRKKVILQRLKEIDGFIPPRHLIDKMALRRTIPKGGDYLTLVTAERYNQIRLVKEQRTATYFEADDPVVAGQAAGFISSLEEKKHSIAEKRHSQMQDLQDAVSSLQRTTSGVSNGRDVQAPPADLPPPPPSFPEPDTPDLPGAVYETVDPLEDQVFYKPRKSEVQKLQASPEARAEG